MSIIVFIILGGVIGWLAAMVLGRREGIISSIVIGIVGSFIGSFVSRLFVGSDQSYLSVSAVGLFWSFIGAIILVAILNLVTRSHHNSV